MQRENAPLRHQLDLLCQPLFGKKSERVSPDQLRLAFAQLANVPAAAVDDPVEMDSGERPGRRRQRRVPPPGRHHAQLVPGAIFVDGQAAVVDADACSSLL